METTTKNKKSFPIASILFLLYAVATIASQLYTVIQNISILTRLQASPPSANVLAGLFGGFQYYEEIDAAKTNLITSIVFLIIYTVFGATPYILMAISAFKTTKKPSVVYIIASSFASLVAFIFIISALISLITALINNNLGSLVTNVFGFISQLLLLLTLTSVLIFTILMKVVKKPSKLSGFWFIFCTPGCLYLVTILINIIFEYLIAPWYAKLLFQSINPVSIKIIITLLGALILVAALFCVARQFAQGNKNLETSQTEAVTE